MKGIHLKVRIVGVLLLLVGLAGEGTHVYSQELESRFEPLSVAGQDDMRRVSCMLQDHIGFMWFGTSNGLYRYDGYELNAYQNDPEEATSLPDNYVYTLFEDSQNRLWIGTDNGLTWFDRESDMFYTIRHDPDDPHSLADAPVQTIWEGEEGNLWVGTRGGLYKIGIESLPSGEPENNKADFSFQLQAVTPVGELSVQVLLANHHGGVWVGTAGKLMQVDGAGNLLGAYPLEPKALVSSLQELPTGEILVGSSVGLRIFDPLQKTIKPAYYGGDQGLKLTEIGIKTIKADHLGQIWIGAETGDLFRIDPNTRELSTHYVAQNSDPQSLISDDILDLYIDRSGLLWVSSYLYGVFKLDLIRISFGTVREQQNQSESLLSEDVNAITEDHQGTVWIGTAEGLSLMNKRTERHQYLQHDPEDSTSLSEDAVYCLLRDSRDRIWVGTFDGLNVVSRKSVEEGTYKFTRYYADEGTGGGLIGNDITALLEDRQGRIWVGTSDGLNSLNPESGMILSYRHIESNSGSLSDNGIRVLFQDQAGIIWIGTENGLNRLQPNLDEGSAFTRYLRVEGDTNTLASNTILSITEDDRGYLWIGTDGGLCSLSPEREQFRTYTSADGLPANDICGMLEDEEKSLWLSTTSGISRMKRRGDSDSYSFVNYDKSNWLSFDQFNPGAYFRNERGFVYFGSHRGMVYFHPDLISENEYPPPVAITEFVLTYLSDEELREVSLPVNISETQELELAYRYNNMVIQYAALSFLDSDKNEYAYMLEGYNDAWQYVKDQRTAPFTNLDPGTYTFRVKAANNHGMWNEEGTHIRIKIRPPIYLTNAFLFFCLLMLILMILAYGKIRTRGLEKNKKILEARVAERTQEVERQKTELETILDNLKSTQSQLVESEKMASLGLLTAGVAHEINNPINFVSGNVDPLRKDIADLMRILEAYEKRVEAEKLNDNFSEVDQLKDELDYDFVVEEIQHLLGGIKEGARRTSEIVKGLRNFSRLDEDELKKANVNEGIQSTLLILGSEFRERIEVITELGDVPEILCYPGKLNQVYMNVITNAIQAIEDQGKIYVRTAVENGHVVVSIRDTGRGMTEEVQQRIFDPFFTTKEVGHGTGLGLSISFGIIENHKGKISVKSIPGEGSEFEILLPIDPS